MVTLTDRWTMSEILELHNRNLRGHLKQQFVAILPLPDFQQIVNNIGAASYASAFKEKKPIHR